MPVGPLPRNRRATSTAAVGIGALAAAAVVTLVLSRTASTEAVQSTAPSHHDHGLGSPPTDGREGAPTFYSDMADVNARMHEGMAISPSGDVDRDFMRMMIAHHQGAIDMAVVLLKYGHDERLRRLAQSIIVEQGQEIAYMRTLLGEPPGQSPARPPNAEK